MSRFSQLIDEVADSKNHTLSQVLLKAKVLGSRLPGRKFKQWVEWEIGGYTKDEDLPPYRIINTTVEGVFEGYFHTYKSGVPLSLSRLPSHIAEPLKVARMRHGVAFMEDLIQGAGHIATDMTPFLINIFRTHSTQIDDMVLNRVFVRVSQHSVVGVLSSVRSRLLDFLLDLQSRHPELDDDDAAIGRIAGSEADAVAERKIYNNCVVNEGCEMRDNYTAGQAGNQGPSAKIESINFIQVLRESIGSASLAELAADLEKLRVGMIAESKTAEQDSAVAAVSEAEAAAKKGDAGGVLASLKKAGAWAQDMALKVGSAIAQKALEKAIGL